MDLFCGRDDEATRAGRHCCLQLWQTRLAVFMEEAEVRGLAWLCKKIENDS